MGNANKFFITSAVIAVAALAAAPFVGCVHSSTTPQAAVDAPQDPARRCGRRRRSAR